MPKRNADGLDLTKHHINLFAGDLDRLRELVPSVEPSIVVRKLVRDTINKLEAGREIPKIEV